MLPAEQGNGDAAAHLLTQGFQLTASLKDARFIEHMIRHAVEGRLLETSQYCLDRTRFTTSSLERLDSAVAIESDESWRDTVRVEHCSALSMFDYVQKGGHLEDLMGESRKPMWKRAVQWFDFSQERKVRYSDSDYLLYVRTIPERVGTSMLPAPNSWPDLTETGGIMNRTWSAKWGR